MRKDVEYRSGGFYTRDKNTWLWPKDDKGAWEWMCMEPHLPSIVTKHVKQRRTCIIAGAHAGFYTKQYAYAFYKVMAFEPEARNFACLIDNVEEPNVIKLQVSLSNRNSQHSLKSADNTNSGGYFIVSGEDCISVELDHIVPMEVDLIHLDVEGHELEVLEGAQGIIEHYKPTIVVEHTYPKYPLVEEFLRSFDYTPAEVLRFDTIFT
jgi:FkbM family methyltransferase